MRTTWISICSVAALAAGVGLVAGRATAGDDPMAGGMPPVQKTIDGAALVKALAANKWTTKATGMMPSEGTASFRLGVGNTVLIEEYAVKGSMGEFHGLGVFKWSDDAKTASIWWFDSMSPTPTLFTGPATDTGYELTGDMIGAEGKASKAVIKLVKKGDGFEFTMTEGTNVVMTDVYTKAK